MTGAHLLKYTPQGFQCTHDECMKGVDGGDPVVGWGLGPDGITYGDLVAAGLHCFLRTAMQQANEPPTNLDKDDLNAAFRGAAAMAEWASVKPQDCFLGRKGADKLRRCMKQREATV